MGSSFDYAGPTPIRVRRVSDEPIVAADSLPGYGPIFNAGVIHQAGRFHLFARGVRAGYRRNDGPGDRFLDYISDVLVFTSDDGRCYEFQQVLAAASPDGVYSYEDPRVQRLTSDGSQRVFISYTNLSAPESGLPWRVGVQGVAFECGRFCLNPSSGHVVGRDGIKDKDAVLFNLLDGRVALIHRIHPNIQLALFDSLDELWDPAPEYWDEHLRHLEQHTLIRPSNGAISVGAGAPPIATDAGLVLFFHEREGDGHYTTKVALLDEGTGRVRSLLPDPIMRAELPWECAGDVDNVIFVQGAVPRPDGTIYLTYGAADCCVGAASVAATELYAASGRRLKAVQATRSGLVFRALTNVGYMSRPSSSDAISTRRCRKHSRGPPPVGSVLAPGRTWPRCQPAGGGEFRQAVKAAAGAKAGRRRPPPSSPNEQKPPLESGFDPLRR